MKLTANTLEALLGRPLTQYESQNRDLYLKIANESLSDLLCSNLCDDEDNPRTFNTRVGYRTLFTGIFNELNEVKLNGDVVDADDYQVQQWDARNGSWFNSIVFEDKFVEGDEVIVDAEWGFDKVPADLQFVLAGLFGLITKKNKFDGTVASKQTEDFRITFNNDVDLDEEFYSNYGKTIDKYSMCHLGYGIRHGKVGYGC